MPAFVRAVPRGRVNIVRATERIPCFSVCVCALYGREEREQVREISAN